MSNEQWKRKIIPFSLFIFLFYYGILCFGGCHEPAYSIGACGKPRGDIEQGIGAVQPQGL
jgi:hypothetical protein